MPNSIKKLWREHKREEGRQREIAYALSPQETRLNTQFLLKQNVDFCQSVKGVLQL